MICQGHLEKVRPKVLGVVNGGTAPSVPTLLENIQSKSAYVLSPFYVIGEEFVKKMNEQPAQTATIENFLTEIRLKKKEEDESYLIFECA